MATLVVLFLIVISSWSLGSFKPQFPPSYGFANTNPFKNPPKPPPIQGTYSFTDPDGVRRTVSYTGDGVSGFNIVEQPQTDKPQDENNNGTTATPENKDKEEPSKDKNVQYVPIPVYPPPQTPSYNQPFYPYPPNPYRFSPYRYPSFG